MRLLPAAVERLLCPPCSWSIHLSSPFPPAECAALLNERRVKNLAEDLLHRQARTAAEIRWTGPAATNYGFEMVEAGLAGDVRALGKTRAVPPGSLIDISFRLEPRQLIWDALLLVAGWGLLNLAPRVAVYVVIAVSALFVLTQLRRRSLTSAGANGLVALVQDATRASMSSAEGIASVNGA